MKIKMTIQIASVPDREELVAELWYGNMQFGELAHEGNKLTFEIYPRPDGKPWAFDFTELLVQ